MNKSLALKVAFLVEALVTAGALFSVGLMWSKPALPITELQGAVRPYATGVCEAATKSLGAELVEKDGVVTITKRRAGFADVQDAALQVSLLQASCAGYKLESGCVLAGCSAQSPELYRLTLRALPLEVVQ